MSYQILPMKVTMSGSKGHFSDRTEQPSISEGRCISHILRLNVTLGLQSVKT